MKVARILSSSDSYVVIKGDEAITRDEIMEQLNITLPNTLLDFLVSGSIDEIDGHQNRLKFMHKIDEFTFSYPISAPPKLIFLNFNYKDQSGWIRFGRTAPLEPVFYLKPRTCLTGPFEDVKSPDFITQLDFEGELAVVVGERCKNISETNAMTVISGYMIMNDISARDIQYTDIQVSRSKCFDTFAPCGPWITTKMEVRTPNDLRLITKVNGETYQDSRTSNMVLRVEEIVSKLSKVMTLEPGDIISTGTPMGTILSYHGRRPWLKSGDVVEVEIEKLGAIKNHIRFERTNQSM